jgi:hypothetical protein
MPEDGHLLHDLCLHVSCISCQSNTMRSRNVATCYHMSRFIMSNYENRSMLRPINDVLASLVKRGAILDLPPKLGILKLLFLFIEQYKTQRS